MHPHTRACLIVFFLKRGIKDTPAKQLEATFIKYDADPKKTKNTKPTVPTLLFMSLYQIDHQLHYFHSTLLPFLLVDNKRIFFK